MSVASPRVSTWGMQGAACGGADAWWKPLPLPSVCGKPLAVTTGTAERACMRLRLKQGPPTLARAAETRDQVIAEAGGFSPAARCRRPAGDQLRRRSSSTAIGRRHNSCLPIIAAAKGTRPLRRWLQPSRPHSRQLPTDACRRAFPTGPLPARRAFQAAPRHLEGAPELDLFSPPLPCVKRSSVRQQDWLCH